MEKLIGLPIAFLTVWFLIPQRTRQNILIKLFSKAFWVSVVNSFRTVFTDENVMHQETTFYLVDYMDKEDINAEYERREQERKAKRMHKAHLEFTDIVPIIEEKPPRPRSGRN